jgi:hypothetical protein
MKSSLLKNVLDWVLATSVLLSIVFSVQFYFRTKELRTMNATLQAEMQKYQNNNGILSALINDTIEYSKAHPDANLSRILESVKPVPASGPATATKPTAK